MPFPRLEKSCQPSLARMWAFHITWVWNQPHPLTEGLMDRSPQPTCRQTGNVLKTSSPTILPISLGRYLQFLSSGQKAEKQLPPFSIPFPKVTPFLFIPGLCSAHHVSFFLCKGKNFQNRATSDCQGPLLLWRKNTGLSFEPDSREGQNQSRVTGIFYLLLNSRQVIWACSISK